jgi:hypothetical protein
MTRVAQKQSERRTLDAILAALALRPDQEPAAGEAPDFTMRVARRLIGVEITQYQSGATVDDGTERLRLSGRDRLLCAQSCRRPYVAGPGMLAAELPDTFDADLSAHALFAQGSFVEWYSNLAAGYVARPDRTIAEIVAEKSAKRFRPVEELWLAIQCGTASPR